MYKKISAGLSSILNYRTRQNVSSFQNLWKGVKKGNPELTKGEGNLLKKALRKMNNNVSGTVTKKMSKNAYGALSSAGYLEHEAEENRVGSMKHLQDLNKAEVANGGLDPVRARILERKAEARKRVRMWELARERQNQGNNGSPTVSITNAASASGSINDQVKKLEEKAKEKKDESEEKEVIDLMID